MPIPCIYPRSDFKVKREKGQIQELFGKISKSYDFLNSFLSLGVDKFWRKMTISRMPARGPYLDMCAGTLELSLLLRARKTGEDITALDFCQAMVVEGKRKLRKDTEAAQGGKIHILVGDGEILPLRDNIYQGIMVGFGFRNLIDRRSGLKEALRVLKPGGRLLILEFSMPPHPFFRKLYRLYFCHILPPVGNLISGGGRAYHHLKNSVLSFPDQETLASMMKDAGFVKVGHQNLTLGIAALHWGMKPEIRVTALDKL
jgi:demethylmenaquinone methyltransferase/2-methoxy-6-polyprenyl-1,4-benzoquinol methylase